MNASIPNLVIFTDPGMDNDDEVMLVLLVALARSGHLNPLAVITSRAPTILRAKLAKGTFDSLDTLIPVAAGSNETTGESNHDMLENVPYVPGDFDLPPANDLLEKVLGTASRKSIDLLVVAPFTDLADYAKQRPSIVENAVRSVTVMAGARQSTNSSFFAPDDSSNTQSDLKAAHFVYHFVQEKRIPILFFSRFAAYNCPFTPTLYESLSASQHPVGIKLYQSAKTTLQRLWVNVNKSEEERIQSGVPARCDKMWFCSTFGITSADHLTVDTDVWDEVQKLYLYDPLALIAAVPKLRNDFYRSTIAATNGTKHLLIGAAPGDAAIHDPQRLRSFVETELLHELGKRLGRGVQQ